VNTQLPSDQPAGLQGSEVGFELVQFSPASCRRSQARTRWVILYGRTHYSATAFQRLA
jgi:hypothetical protein